MRLNFHGFTITELVVALGLGSLTMMSLMGFMTLQGNAAQRVRAVESRDTLVGLVKRHISSPGLTASAKQIDNPQLTACLKGVICKSLEENPLVLYSPNGSATPISGTPASPRRYDVNGSPCSAGPPFCIFEVFTTYRAQCKPDLSQTLQPPLTCTTPEIIEVFYTIQQTQLPVGADPGPIGIFKAAQGSVVVAL